MFIQAYKLSLSVKNSTIFHWLWSQNEGNGILEEHLKIFPKGECPPACGSPYGCTYNAWKTSLLLSSHRWNLFYLQVFFVFFCVFNARFPLWRAPAGIHGSCIHRCEVSCMVWWIHLPWFPAGARHRGNRALKALWRERRKIFNLLLFWGRGETHIHHNIWAFWGVKLLLSQITDSFCYVHHPTPTSQISPSQGRVMMFVIHSRGAFKPSMEAGSEVISYLQPGSKSSTQQTLWKVKLIPHFLR